MYFKNNRFVEIELLNQKDIEGLMQVFKRTDICPLIPQESGLINQFLSGHFCLGLKVCRLLVGVVFFRYDIFLPWKMDFLKYPEHSAYANPLPVTIDEFLSGVNKINGNALFITHFAIVPEYKNEFYAKKLFKAVVVGIQLFKDYKKVKYIVMPSRCPSFNGSKEYEQEFVGRDDAFQSAIKECGTKKVISLSVLEKDPVVEFNIKVFGLKLFCVIPSFSLNDEPSGKFGLILFKRARFF